MVALSGGHGILLISKTEYRRASIAYVIDELTSAYIRAVDECNLEDWLALFAPQCSYEVHPVENVRAGLPLGYVLDDCRERLIDRVTMIQQVWDGTVELYDTRHIQQRTGMRELDEHRWEVRSNLIVSYSAASGEAGILISGYCDDVVIIENDETALIQKRCVVVENTLPRYLVYPI